MNPNINQLMKQAQKVQEEMKRMQAEIKQMVVTGESGGGTVKVEMTGDYHVKRVTFEPSLLNDDKEILEDLTAAATNDAVRKVKEATHGRMAALSSNFNLPGDFKLPLGDDDL